MNVNGTHPIGCLEVRRMQLADPRALSPGGRAHLDQCAACREHGERLRRDEVTLRAALSVDVP